VNEDHAYYEWDDEMMDWQPRTWYSPRNGIDINYYPQKEIIEGNDIQFSRFPNNFT